MPPSNLSYGDTRALVGYVQDLRGLMTALSARPFDIDDQPESFQYRERFFSQKPESAVRKILFVCPYVPRLGAHGGATVMYNLIRNLTEKYRVSVLAFAHDSEEMSAREPLKAFCEKVELVRLRAAPDSIQAFIACGFSVFRHFFDPNMRGKLLQMLSEDDYDIIHYEMSQMGQYIIPSKRSLNLLSVYELSYLKERECTYSRGLQKRLRWISTLDEEMRAARRADFVITLSDYDRARMARFLGNRKIATIGVGCELKVFSDHSNDKDQSSVAFLGSFMHPPNIEAVLFFVNKILPLIREEAPTVKFLVIASGESSEISRLEGSEISVSYARGPDKDLLLGRCKVFVAPILSGSGVRIKILEAWALGMPVVATSLACRGLDAIDGWNILIADTPKLFADRVLKLFKEDALCQELGRNGLTTVKEYYAWPQIIQKYSKLYSELLSRRR